MYRDEGVTLSIAGVSLVSRSLSLFCVSRPHVHGGLRPSSLMFVCVCVVGSRLGGESE